jgi:chromosome partitioning protein
MQPAVPEETVLPEQFPVVAQLAAREAGPGGSARSAGRRDPLVVAVANQKGGVAKTTTVVSLAGALVKHDREVLAIDLDAQANLTLALGKDPARVRGSITDVLFNSASLVSVSRETSIPGLDLIPANSGMELAERFLPVRQEYERILQRVITTEFRSEPTGVSMRPPSIQYDFILLDCPPYMGAVTLNALTAADLLIIPTQPEYFSAHALRTMMQTIRQVRSQFNPDLAYRILVTMYDRRNRIHREVFDQIHAAFGDGVFETTIAIDTKLRESAVEGLPIGFHKSTSRSAVQYDALVQELIAYVR